MGAATRSSELAAERALGALRRPAASLGDELLDAARTIASSPQLRVLLTDPGIEPEAKAPLIARLFGAASAGAQTVLKTLVAGRWSAEEDLAATAEALGYRALAGTAKDTLESELFQLQRAIASDPDLELALGNQAAPVTSRIGLVERLLRQATPATRSIARHVVSQSRTRRPIEGLQRAEQIVASARGRLVAIAEVASPLQTAQRARLEASLTARYGRAVAVNQIVDPAVVGGVRIRIGDDVIDGTVRARLDALRDRLAG